ncbi:hypothetical protein Sjap_007111 [Stephania japonica]|uniref:BZIP domain-containing protein n=1 Tax=Stephania japonica TaxID=461633 RepID=A0AAP0JPC2_9MAGN
MIFSCWLRFVACGLWEVGMSPTDDAYVADHQRKICSWRSLDHSRQKKKVVSEDEDEDLFTVPDVESRPPLPNTNNNGKRRTVWNPVDREYGKLRRNRVSAQQARERKKVYVNDLKSRAKDLQDRNSNINEKISTLINENNMLRKILMNTRPKVDESTDAK